MPPPDVDQYVTITPYIALLHEGHLRSPSTASCTPKAKSALSGRKTTYVRAADERQTPKSVTCSSASPRSTSNRCLSHCIVIPPLPIPRTLTLTLVFVIISMGISRSAWRQLGMTPGVASRGRSRSRGTAVAKPTTVWAMVSTRSPPVSIVLGIITNCDVVGAVPFRRR